MFEMWKKCRWVIDAMAFFRVHIKKGFVHRESYICLKFKLFSVDDSRAANQDAFNYRN